MTFTPRFTPNPDGLNAEFYAHLAAGELRLQRCDGCGVWRHPPRIMCGRCGSDRWQWVRTSGRGVVFSWTVTHQGLVPPFMEDVPYAVVVVELEEGPRMVTAVRGVEPPALRLGLPVELRIVRASDAIGLHYFVPRS
ncbi:MAG TPA: OB-fold domain-containing protein [Candidatus Eisenbacteria bacterium]|nr:OB-fold domain-containing protein [Candidatus Eisenbacteria bacterium]